MKFNKTFFLIILLAVLLLFIRLGATTLFQIAEARNSEVPAEMLIRHDLITPYFNGELRTDKPPLHYYAMLLSYKLGAMNESSARFFSALCGLLVIAATWVFTRKYAGHAAAFWSSIILLSSIHTIIQFRLATPDPYLIACHVLSLYCFWEGYQNQRKYYLWTMYFLLGLAILAKGPVGLVLPALTILLFLLFEKKWSFKIFRELQLHWGFFIVAIIALPWFYLVHIKTGGLWTYGFFMQHNLDRFSNPVDGHKGPFPLTWLFVLLGLFPFSVFMFRAIIFSFKQRLNNNWLFFNLLAAVVIVATYSIASTKLINYTTPSYPFLAMITGTFIAHYLHTKNSLNKLWFEWVILVIFSIALPVVLFLWMISVPAFNNIAFESILVLVLPLSVLLGVYFNKNKKPIKAFSMIAIGAILMNIFFFSILYPTLDHQGSIYKMKNLVQSGRPIIAYHSFNEAFTFYYKKPIRVMNTASEVKMFLFNHPSTLVLERSDHAYLKDSLPEIQLKASAKDLFSSRYSYIYEMEQ